jgi:crotonobetainyl-CoA:carnitine CoA-transferase CaiB-like acyl-CoA transferase
VLTKLDERHGKQTDERMRPLAGVALGQKADANLRQAAAQTDDYGVPLATMESIKEVASSLPPHLLADPNVVEVVLNSAIGIDRRKGRTPKLPDDPLYLAQAGGGRAPRESVIDAATRSRLESLGLTEKEYTASAKKLEDGAQNRRGIVLGGK